MLKKIKDRAQGTGSFSASGPQLLWTRAFVSFLFVNFFIFMGFNVLLPTLPLYLESHQANEAEIGRIFAIFVVSAVLMRMFAARLAFRFSAFRVVEVGLLLCSIAAIGYYWATSTPLAMVCRFVQGAGVGLASTLITALVSQVIPLHRMGEGMGFFGVAPALALAAGPFFGLWLMNEWGFFIMFLAVAIFYVLGIAVVAVMPKVTLSSYGAAPEMPDKSSAGLAPSVQPAAPAKPKLVLFSRMVAAPSILMLMLGITISAAITYMALYCKERGLPYAGHFFVLSTVGILTSRLNAGRIYDHRGHPFVILPSGFLLLGCMALLYIADSRNLLFAASLLYGFSVGAIFPSLQALAISYAPINRRTEASASFMNAYDVGFGLGAAIMGQIAHLAGNYGIIYLAAAGAMLFFLIYYIVYYLLINKTAGRPARRQKPAG
ncbi:MAG: MFS transporter [Deltaproteobacteria bacterium]|jgi:MFS family permease|nr:MFS transporter [Deltaproteobacteria bacterium]